MALVEEISILQLNKPSHWILKNLMCAIIFVVNALILMSNSAFGASPLHNLLYRRPLGSDVYNGDSKTMLIFLDDCYENNLFTSSSSISEGFAVALYQPFVCKVSSQWQGQYSIVASAALVRMLLSFKALGEPLYQSYKQRLQSLRPGRNVEGCKYIKTTKVVWGTYVIMDWMRQFTLSQQWQMYLFKDDGLVLFVPLTNKSKEDIVLGLGVSALNSITESELQNYLVPEGFRSDLRTCLHEVL